MSVATSVVAVALLMSFPVSSSSHDQEAGFTTLSPEIVTSNDSTTTYECVTNAASAAHWEVDGNYVTSTRDSYTEGIFRTIAIVTNEPGMRTVSCCFHIERGRDCYNTTINKTSSISAAVSNATNSTITNGSDSSGNGQSSGLHPPEIDNSYTTATSDKGPESVSSAISAEETAAVISAVVVVTVLIALVIILVIIGHRTYTGNSKLIPNSADKMSLNVETGLNSN